MEAINCLSIEEAAYIFGTLQNIFAENQKLTLYDFNKALGLETEESQKQKGWNNLYSALIRYQLPYFIFEIESPTPFEEG